MTEYRIFSKSVCDREKCIYETYGIEAYESGEVIRKVGDISTDKTAVSELVRLFNEEGLSGRSPHLNYTVFTIAFLRRI